MSIITKSDSKNRTMEHFDKTAGDYNNSSDGKFVEPMYDAIVAEIEKTESGKILDVGCGNGNLFNCLNDERYELTGVDFSVNMIDEAMRNCGARASFLVADAERLPFDDKSFDIVVCNASFHHYIHPNVVLGEMKRVLKDGGKVIIGDPYVPGPVRPIINVLIRFSEKGDYHFYGLKEMEDLFEKNGFSPISSEITQEHRALHVAQK